MAGIPRRDAEPLPERPSAADENSELEADWKRRRAQIHARNASEKGKRLSVAQQLWVARKLMDFPAIYYPHELDWRGRVYPVPQAGPHPQAGDAGRALLEFATGKPLGTIGGRWLAIHVANVFGVDKVSFDERVAWVEKNGSAILDSARDPLDGRRFWATAEKPWAALAACFEWAGYAEQGEAFVSHLPIAIDGSNSGLQHLTALLRDGNAAPHVNLMPLDSPGDIYALVAAKMQATAGMAFLQMLAVFAQFETAIRKERQMEGIAKAKMAGVYKGRKPSVPVDEVRRLKREGASPTEIAKRLGIGRGSVYRALEARE